MILHNTEIINSLEDNVGVQTSRYEYQSREDRLFQLVYNSGTPPGVLEAFSGGPRNL